MTSFIDRIHLRVASDPDVFYVRTYGGRITHKKGLPGLTLCREYLDHEFAGMVPCKAQRYNCKKCKAAEASIANRQDRATSCERQSSAMRAPSGQSVKARQQESTQTNERAKGRGSTKETEQPR